MAKKKILVVDDEESLCRSIKLNLEDSGNYEVRTESKGSQALAAAKIFKPDLVILDFIMPDLDGSAVAHQMHEDEETKNIPIIFLTAIATKEDMQTQGGRIGGQIILAKPISTEVLIKSIEKNLGEKPKIDLLSKFFKKSRRLSK